MQLGALFISTSAHDYCVAIIRQGVEVVYVYNLARIIALFYSVIYSLCSRRDHLGLGLYERQIFCRFFVIPLGVFRIGANEKRLLNRSCQQSLYGSMSTRLCRRTKNPIFSPNGLLQAAVIHKLFADELGVENLNQIAQDNVWIDDT